MDCGIRATTHRTRMIITKADGGTEEFKPQKLVLSLKRAGATQDEITRILAQVEFSLSDGMKTQMIYQKAFQLLRESTEPVAARYSLRRAVFALGPTGFPFEDFLGRIFEAEGYKTKRRLILRGKCATHEVDLAAYSPEDTFIAEAKFHARPGTKSDLQVVMYSYARFLDLSSTRICKGDQGGIISLRVITNTKFTDAAIRYATCSGFKVLSWDYPRNNSLHDMIERYKTYPVTVLTHLSTSQKQYLLSKGVILSNDIVKNPLILHELGLPSRKFDAVLHEASSLCG